MQGCSGRFRNRALPCDTTQPPARGAVSPSPASRYVIIERVYLCTALRLVKTAPSHPMTAIWLLRDYDGGRRARCFSRRNTRYHLSGIAGVALRGPWMTSLALSRRDVAIAHRPCSGRYGNLPNIARNGGELDSATYAFQLQRLFADLLITVSQHHPGF